MMLLQAGQLGLYRKDSIWTSDIPPEMVAGATMWLDFTDSATLFPNNDLTGTTPADGEALLSIADKVLPGAGAKFFSGTPLIVKIPGVNGKPAASHGLSSLQMEVLAAFPVTSALAQSLVTTTTKLVVAGLKVRAAGLYTSSPWVADAVMFDAGGYFGMHLMQSGLGDGSIIATAYNYSASGVERADCPIAANEWQVITMSQQSGALRCRVNGGAWASVSSSATSTLASNVRILDGSTLDADIAHLATVNTAQSDAAISAVEHWIANDVGIAPWW